MPYATLWRGAMRVILQTSDISSVSLQEASRSQAGSPPAGPGHGWDKPLERLADDGVVGANDGHTTEADEGVPQPATHHDSHHPARLP